MSKNLAALYIRIENNPEFAKTTSRDKKAPVMNNIIGNQKNLQKETRFTRILWNLVM